MLKNVSFVTHCFDTFLRIVCKLQTIEIGDTTRTTAARQPRSPREALKGLLAFCRLVDAVLHSKIFGESCGGTDDVDII